MRDLPPRAQDHVVLLVPPQRLGPQLGTALVAAQEFLAERRAVVGAVDLLPDEQEGALAVDRADRLRRRARREAAADEQVLHVWSVHGCFLLMSRPSVVARAARVRQST